MRFRIVVLGAHGHFGGRIVRALAQEPPIELILAGRKPAPAAEPAGKLAGGAAKCEAVGLDHCASDFAARLRALRPNLVIHAAGPFQGQSYHVARAAIDVGAHYLDLADSRAFVSGITCLHDTALERGLVVAAGASTVPAVSSAVVEHLQGAFAHAETIAICIAPGQKTPRGLATLRAILSCCGGAFDEWSDGAWRQVYGWQGLRLLHLPDIGTRWAARCDVPDLELLPAWYPTLRTVRFEASLELATTHLGLWLLAWLVRAGLIRRPEKLAATLLRLARQLDRFGSDVGGMRVRIEGVGQDGKRLRLDWCLTAKSGHGPEIPCVPAVVIARKLARGEPLAPGARPCHGMMTLEEFDAAVRHTRICWHVYEQTGP